MMSLSLSWTYQKDKVLFLIKFELKIIILFKYCVDVKNCERLRGFGFIREIEFHSLSSLD